MTSPLALRVDTMVLEPKTFSRCLASSSASPLLAETPKCASTSSAGSACGASGNVFNGLFIPASCQYCSSAVAGRRYRKWIGRGLSQVNVADRPQLRCPLLALSGHRGDVRGKADIAHSARNYLPVKNDRISVITSSAIKAVAAHPTQTSQRRARNRPITEELVISAIMMAITGTETTPFNTALHTSILIGSKEVNPSPKPIAVAARMMT